MKTNNQAKYVILDRRNYIEFFSESSRIGFLNYKDEECMWDLNGQYFMEIHSWKYNDGYRRRRVVFLGDLRTLRKYQTESEQTILSLATLKFR